MTGKKIIHISLVGSEKNRELTQHMLLRKLIRAQDRDLEEKNLKIQALENELAHTKERMRALEQGFANYEDLEKEPVTAEDLNLAKRIQLLDDFKTPDVARRHIAQELAQRRREITQFAFEEGFEEGHNIATEDICDFLEEEYGYSGVVRRIQDQEHVTEVET
jgi:hypothetical protein